MQVNIEIALMLFVGQWVGRLKEFRYIRALL